MQRAEGFYLKNPLICCANLSPLIKGAKLSTGGCKVFMKLSVLAKILHGTLMGADVEFNNIVIDSRVVKSGDCFIAIKGDFFDGHDFIEDIAKKSAAVAIVDRDMSSTIPLIKVKNTRSALMDIARYYRDSAHIPVAAITGSCGKTTTRALLENILKQKGHVLASQKSFNNDIGLPLTLLQLNPTHDFAVLEIGTNHPGEIAPLTAIAKPTVATVTMVAPVHIEHFSNVEAIAREKGAIFEGLTSDGIAVINADDHHAALWKKMSGHHHIITFGQENKADVMAIDLQVTETGQTTFTLVLPNNKANILLPLLGQHNVTNALAAAAMAFAMHISIDDIKKGLETAQPEYGRLVEKKGFSGALVIDDTYNANPASVKAAIQLLTHRSHNAILVFGDMAELGEIADNMHTEIGEFAKAAGLQRLFCYGKHSVKTAQAFGKNAQHFEDYETLIASLKPYLTPEVTVLIKGSRSMKMETVVKALLN
jgi:UDP-N-acetylmuramoyl-tripeptide--D-alanyl-D-alanine ligase